MNVAAIMPCRGRAEQTVRNVRRLLSTAGYSDWQLTCIGSEHERDVLLACSAAGAKVRSVFHIERLTYWQALAEETRLTDAPLLCNLANDLLPGQHWLQRAVAAYTATFGDGPGLLGFNDGHHETEHSCHFLISRTLLDDYGGWPVWYDHNFGDTELCQRAIADGLYAKAPWATLYHDHPYFGGDDDAVYVEGRARVDQDLALFNRRKANGWQ
jgi:hypothetical protein